MDGGGGKVSYRDFRVVVSMNRLLPPLLPEPGAFPYFGSPWAGNYPSYPFPLVLDFDHQKHGLYMDIDRLIMQK